jgi:hypothetical protein
MTTTIPWLFRLVACWLGLALLPSPVVAGKLDQVRDAADGCSSCCSKDDSDDDSTDDADDDSGGDDSDPGTSSGDGDGTRVRPWMACLIPPIGLLVCVPRLLIEGGDAGDDDGEGPPPGTPSAFFLPRPYMNGHRGHLLDVRALWRQFPESVERTPDEIVVTDHAAEVLAREPALSFWSARLETEYAMDLSRVHRPALALSVDSISRFGLTARWTHYLEPLPGGELDQLGIGDLNLTYRVAQGEAAEVRLGLGARLLVDDGATLGFNFTYAIDLFPTDPLVISVGIDLGNLGRAFYGHGRVTLGAVFGRIEPYLGYDLAWIAGPDAGALFQGPVAGVRAWF